jgi:hypothetical protein
MQSFIQQGIVRWTKEVCNYLLEIPDGPVVQGIDWIHKNINTKHYRVEKSKYRDCKFGLVASRDYESGELVCSMSGHFSKVPSDKKSHQDYTITLVSVCWHDGSIVYLYSNPSSPGRYINSSAFGQPDEESIQANCEFLELNLLDPTSDYVACIYTCQNVEKDTEFLFKYGFEQ